MWSSYEFVGELVEAELFWDSCRSWGRYVPTYFVWLGKSTSISTRFLRPRPATRTLHATFSIRPLRNSFKRLCVKQIRSHSADTLDPPPLGTVHLDQAKTEYGDRFFFKGNLDAVNEMLHADDATFEQAVKDRIEIGKPGSGYILSSACSVAPHVKPERLQRLAEIAERLGTY